jgi:hypothetical protein
VQFDMGLQALGILAAISLAFGIIVHLLLARRTTRWLWLIAAAGWFIGGLLASEVVWGSMTEEEIQPIIDGLAFDEALLGGVVGGAVAVVATWIVTRIRRPQPPGRPLAV